LDRQRIDKWLWHARVVRTRSAAASLADAGKVRVNGARINAPSKTVRVGDVLTIALDRVRVLKVQGFCERRGPAEAGRALYEDLAPPVHIQEAEEVDKAVAIREPGTGRPTKRQRRALDRLRSDHDI
jgi:ribosome-associated heat shock protein Hsp15